jgi:hypothetical protein
MLARNFPSFFSQIAYLNDWGKLLIRVEAGDADKKAI